MAMDIFAELFSYNSVNKKNIPAKTQDIPVQRIA
jgi:hypothetical protein